MTNELSNLEYYPAHEITKKEVVKSFLINLLYYLDSGKDIPGLNFIFPKDSIDYLNSFDIVFFDSSKICTEVLNTEQYNIQIKDTEVFFELLTNIVNELIKLNCFYKEKYYGSLIIDDLLKNIWLRMGSEDFNNVEMFLENQLAFLKNRTLDKPNMNIAFINSQNKDVSYQVRKNPLYFESTRCIQFKIHDNEDCHDLPNILYDIKEENSELVCYIFGVQMPTLRHKSKKIERDLYKINANVEECLVHPNFLMAMTLFFELLRKNEINHVKVPLLQVLSYEYHTILSNNIKENFKDRWSGREKLMLESMLYRR